MTLDELMTQCEEVWRDAMMTNRSHVSATTKPWIIEGSNGAHECAASILDSLWDQFPSVLVRCPQFPCPYEDKVAYLMIHLNDIHRWTWDMFANKFRGLVESARQ